MCIRMVPFPCLFVLWIIISANDSYHTEFKITIIEHTSLNITAIIDEYFDQKISDIIVLPFVSDINHMCNELQSLFSNKDPLPESTPSHYILFLDLSQNIMSFVEECEENNLDFEIIKKKLFSNHTLVLSQLMMRKKETKQYPRALLNTVDTSLGTWIEGTSALPSTDYNMAPFVYNNTIYLLGGAFSSRNKQIIVFHPFTQSFSDLGDVLSVSCEGSAQFYTQIDNMAYWAGSRTISRYDLSTNQLFANEITGVNNTMKDSCMASYKNLLFVIGGSYDTKKGLYPALHKVQIYDLFANMWLKGVPSMIRPRTELSCTVHQQYNMLYAIAGSNRLYPTLDYEPIVEKIYVNDILNNAWQEITDRLSIGVIQSRAVIYEEYIMVIGGYCYFYPRNICPGAVDAVQLINVVTDEITVGPSLTTANQQFGAIYNAYDDRIYVFGGFSKDTFSYLKLKTDSPTNVPTAAASPTVSPTADPTESPSVAPTNNPTFSPTNNPTFSPTNNPTFSPTNNPSPKPTDDPTIAPTLSPSKDPIAVPPIFPSKTPTVDPSAAPVKKPTVDPTHIPTISPSSVHPSDAPTDIPTHTIAPSQTEYTSNPPNVPSIAPTISGTIFIPSTSTMTDITGTADADAHRTKNTAKSTKNIILIVVFALLSVTFFILWMKKRKELIEMKDSMYVDDGVPYIALKDPDNDQL